MLLFFSMIQQFFPYLIFIQVSVWLFHAGIGVETWLHNWVYDSQSLFLLFLSLGTFVTFIRFENMPENENSLKKLSEHMIFLGMIMWLFYRSWSAWWEVFLISFMAIFLGVFIILSILESQLGAYIWAWKLTLPDYFWKIGAFLTLVNTITISLIFILLHEKLDSLWVFFAINWIFLWKIGSTQETSEIMS